MFHRERKSNQHFWMNYPLSLLPSESPREFPIAISSKQVREVLRSEVSKSVPVTNQATAIETKCSQVAAVCQRLKEGEINQQPAEEAIQIDPAKPGLLCCFLVTADNNTSGIFHIFQLVIFTLSMCMFFFPSLPSVQPEVNHEAKSRWGTWLSVHQKEPAVHRSQWRVNKELCELNKYVVDICLNNIVIELLCIFANVSFSIMHIAQTIWSMVTFWFLETKVYKKFDIKQKTSITIILLPCDNCVSFRNCTF